MLCGEKSINALAELVSPDEADWWWNSSFIAMVGLIKIISNKFLVQSFIRSLQAPENVISKLKNSKKFFKNVLLALWIDKLLMFFFLFNQTMLIFCETLFTLKSTLSNASNLNDNLFIFFPAVGFLCFAFIFLCKSYTDLQYFPVFNQFPVLFLPIFTVLVAMGNKIFYIKEKKKNQS